MDINSAEKAVKKLLAYAQDLSDTKPRMYQKSREKLMNLVEACSEIVTLVTSVIQDESLAEDVVEFGSDTVDVDIESAINDMQTKLDQLCAFTGMTPSGSAVQASTKSVSDSVFKGPESLDNSKTVRSSKKIAFRKYAQVLQDLSATSGSFKYPAITSCAKLLWNWFSNRFVNLPKNSKFKYNMTKFPTWIRDFVVLFGKSIRDNTYLDLCSKVSAWVDDISDSAESPSNMYAIPFELFDFERNMKSDDMSLEAIVLWDILMDNGLSELCTTTRDDLYLKEDAVYDLCELLNPGVLDSYVDYTDHPEIFITLGWEVRKHA